MKSFVKFEKVIHEREHLRESNKDKINKLYEIQNT